MLGASSEPINVIKQFVADQGVTFPILYDQGGTLRNDYFLSRSLSPFPRDYIIDQNGIIRYTSTEYHPQTMIEVIESLLSENTDIHQNRHKEQPDAFELLQSYPNPFNQQTTIAFELPSAAKVELAVYNVHGERVALVEHRRFTAGRHRAKWDGKNTFGNPLPSGVYFIRMRGDGF